MRTAIRSDRHQEMARRLGAGANSPRRNSLPLPFKDAVVRLLDHARLLLFPAHSCGESGGRLEQALAGFREELCQLLQCAHVVQHGARKDLTPKVQEIAWTMVERLPKLQALLETDVQAAYDGDPALHSLDEAVLCYPGITAVFCHRLAHELYVLKVPLLPRMLASHGHSQTGIDIHPGARIGESFFIDHGTGVVIGETSVIGRRVRLYQGVTLGARSFPSDHKGRLVKGIPRHPILEDDVVVYSWASILGRITIGRGSIIGGNVWVTRDVPPQSLVTQAQVRQTGFADGAGI